MGLVKFAIDLAAVLNASRSVASRHVALRSRQLDAYTRTSSAASALRNGAARSAPAAEPHEKEIDARTVTEESAPVHSSEIGQEASPAQVDRAAPEQPSDQPGTEQHAAPRPDISASQVRRDPTVDISFKFEKARQQPATTNGDKKEGLDLPPDVDINVFQTSRGSKILDSLRKGSKEDVECKTKVGGPAKEHPLRYWPQQPPPPAEDISSEPASKAQASQPEKNERDATASSVLDPNEHEASQSPAEETNGVATEAKVEEEVIEVARVLASEGASQPTPAYSLRESAVPSSRVSRLWNYGGLAVGMLGGAMTESVSRAFGSGGTGSVLLNGKNMERLVAKLSRMRGAALKLGQMMSFQDTKMLPGPIQEVLQRVQDRADYMPAWQRDRVMVANLGADWRELFSEFEEKPIAAASIGQVHKAVLKSNGKRVAVKVQFPGVADSINSDLDNLGILLNATKLLPKGLYLNKTIDNARLELGWECNYTREAECATRYKELLAAEDDVFLVPSVYPEASGKHVLTMDFMEGTGVTRIKSFTQEQRDWIGTQILRLCLREITEFKFMQTDPNWTNFLYNAEINKLELLDFGASREYPDEFVMQYVQLLEAASRSDRDAVKSLSESLGYLTGHESKIMLDAHIQSVLTLAEPFLESAPEVYDFEDQTITERVKALIPVMLRERLAPPPEETYSLHRKLSGAFLLCAKLGSRVRCREMFQKSLKKSGYIP